MGHLKFYFYIEARNYVETRKWCIKEFGSPTDYKWNIIGNNEIGGEVYFTEIEDAVAFKLRWV